MPSIGVLSSIPCDPPFKDFLEPEIKANVSAATFTYKDDKNTPQALQQAVQEFNAGNPVAIDYIITLGGRVAYNSIVAASSANTKRFFSLVGAVPSNLPALCRGGVSLESYGHNADRADYLITQKGFNAANSVSLFYNQNSPLANDELGNWNTLRGTRPQLVANPVQAMLTGTNNAADYATTVSNITTQAVIISADPYFHKTRQKLVSALNGAGKYVVYPLYNYANANPSPGSSVLLGSTLEHAIKVLAAVVALAINNNQTVGFMKEPAGKPKEII